MKSLRTYLIVVCALLFAAVSFGIYVWYKIQTLDLESQEVLPAEEAREANIRDRILEEAQKETAEPAAL